MELCRFPDFFLLFFGVFPHVCIPDTPGLERRLAYLAIPWLGQIGVFDPLPIMWVLQPAVSVQVLCFLEYLRAEWTCKPNIVCDLCLLVTWWFSAVDRLLQLWAVLLLINFSFCAVLIIFLVFFDVQRLVLFRCKWRKMVLLVLSFSRTMCVSGQLYRLVLTFREFQKCVVGDTIFCVIAPPLSIGHHLECSVCFWFLHVVFVKSFSANIYRA